MAGTFQDRLVSELRLAGATTIDQANAVLQEFLPRFNRQFRVPAQQPQVAYRPLDSSLVLERVLCFKHTRQVARDNTVKFQWRTLQLLPGENRPSYAGGQGGGTGAKRWPARGPLWWGSHPPPGSPAKARCLESLKRRPGTHPGDGPGGQEPGTARPVQIAVAAPGSPGSGCTPAPGGSRPSPA